MKNLSKCQTKKKKKKNQEIQLPSCVVTHLYKRGYFGIFLFHIQLKCLCQGTLYQCLRLPTIFFQIIHTSKQGPINQPSEPCSFQLLRTLFLQCFGSQQSKAKPGPHFVHASCYDMCIQASFKIIILSIQIWKMNLHSLLMEPEKNSWSILQQKMAFVAKP